MTITTSEILFLVVVFFANIIEAITGFAGTLLSMPASMLLIGVDEAKTVLNFISLMVCGSIAIRYFREANKKEFVKILGFMLAGMAVGVYLFKLFPVNMLLNLYAVLIIVIAIKGLFVKKEFKLPDIVMLVILFAAGIIHGMFVSGGALLVIYAVKALKDKSEFRATLASVWTVLNGAMFINHLCTGMVNSHTLKLMGFSIVPVIAAVVVGSWLHNIMNQKVFLVLTYILLLLSGIMLLV